MTFTSKSFPSRSSRGRRPANDFPCELEGGSRESNLEIVGDWQSAAMARCERCQGGPCLNEPEAA